jgi:hypothetical protein
MDVLGQVAHLIKALALGFAASLAIFVLGLGPNPQPRSGGLS